MHARARKEVFGRAYTKGFDENATRAAIKEAARERGLPTSLITDAGRTEFGGVPTRTAVAVGPAVVGEIDAITGPEGLVATKLA